MFNRIRQNEKPRLWAVFGVVLTTIFITECECKNRKENCCEGQQTSSSQLMGCAPNGCNFGVGQKMPMVPWCHSMSPSYPPSGIPPSYYVQSVTIGKSDSKCDDDKPCCKKKRKSRQEVSEESDEDCEYEYEEPSRAQRNKYCSQRRKSVPSRSDYDPSQRNYEPQQYRAESNYDSQYRPGCDTQQFRSANYDPIEQSRTGSFDPVLENYDPNTRNVYENQQPSFRSSIYEAGSDACYDRGVQRSYGRSRSNDQFDFETDPVEEEEEEEEDEEDLEDAEDYYDPPPKRRKCKKRKCKPKCKREDKCEARICKKRKSCG